MNRILVHDHAQPGLSYQAAFEPVRTEGRLTLGWATLNVDGDEFRFPVIVDKGFGRVLTVWDWQAGFSDVDLADPEDLDLMARTRQGTFVTPAGAPTVAHKVFGTLSRGSRK